MGNGNYTVVVDGQKFSVQVAEGDANIQVTEVNGEAAQTTAPSVSTGDGEDVKALVPGNVWKIVANPGDKVSKDSVIMILESMKMEIDVVAPCEGIVQTINVNTNDKVVEGQLLAVVG